MKLSGRLVTVGEIAPRQREAMFALMDLHYANVERADFERDLAEKQWVILLSDRSSGQLCGFSTQRLLHAEVAGRRVQVLFSGDTIIDREHWGDPALAHVWGQLTLALLDAHPNEEFYWYLISQGYKTYRFLPVFFHEYYPRPECPTPLRVQAILDVLGRTRYPDTYDPSLGIIRARPGQYQLRAGIADITEERLQDPHIRFFLARNPGHVRGDELCCLAPLSRDNYTRAAWRVIGPNRVLAGVP